MARDGVHGHEHAQEGSTDERWSPWQPRGWLGSPSSGDSPVRALVISPSPTAPDVDRADRVASCPHHLADADSIRRRQGGQGGGLPSSSR